MDVRTAACGRLISIACTFLAAALLAAPAGAQIAAGKSKYLGSITGNSVPANFTTYWNQVTPENATKWGSVEGTRNSMNWAAADAAYNWAQQNGYPFKFHTLVWGAQFPNWLTNSGLTQAQQRAPAVGGLRRDGSAVPLGHLAHDRQAQPGTGPAAGGVGAEEAVEDLGALVVRDSRPAVADGQLAVAQAHVDRRVGRAPLRGVVEQVGDGAIEPRRDALHQRGLELGRERHAGCMAPGALHRRRDEVIEPHVLGLRRLWLVIAGELDEVADERGQLLQLCDEVGSQPVAVVGVRRAAAREHLEVRPQ